MIRPSSPATQSSSADPGSIGATSAGTSASTVMCPLCFHHCRLREGQTGLCQARMCRGGAIVPIQYGLISSLALDPIEKKPLRQFHPGSTILSIGGFGCNLRCPFCQNHSISMPQGSPLPEDSIIVSPEALTEKAAQLRPRGNIGLAYTYNEPLVCYEFVRDCAELIRRKGMYNVLVSNGTIEEEPLRQLLPLIDAANIDLKGFTDAWYRELGGDLETVRRTITLAADHCHLEVTTLIVPGKNDSPEEMRALSRWLASIRPDIPLHVSRFFPRYRMQDQPPTPVRTVYALADIAREALQTVYTGNC